MDLKWKREDNPNSEAVISGNRLYFVKGTGHVEEIDIDDGERVGSWGAGHIYPKGLAIHGNKLIVCNDTRDGYKDTSMFALDIEDGLDRVEEPIWEFETGWNGQRSCIDDCW